MIGDPDTGKTTLIKRFTQDRFEKRYKPTKGATECLKQFYI